MAHPNLERRRRAIAELVAGGVSIDSAAARRLARKFRCSVSAIDADARLAKGVAPYWRAESVRQYRHDYHQRTKANGDR